MIKGIAVAIMATILIAGTGFSYGDGFFSGVESSLRDKLKSAGDAMTSAIEKHVAIPGNNRLHNQVGQRSPNDQAKSSAVKKQTNNVARSAKGIPVVKASGPSITEARFNSLGLSPGMLPSEVRLIMKKTKNRYSVAFFDVNKASLKYVKGSDFIDHYNVNWQSHKSSGRYGDHDITDYQAVYFSAPPNKSISYSVVLSEGFPKDGMPARDTFYRNLIKKYGEPSAVGIPSFPHPNWIREKQGSQKKDAVRYFLWAWNKEGKQVMLTDNARIGNKCFPDAKSGIVSVNFDYFSSRSGKDYLDAGCYKIIKLSIKSWPKNRHLVEAFRLNVVDVGLAFRSHEKTVRYQRAAEKRLEQQKEAKAEAHNTNF